MFKLIADFADIDKDVLIDAAFEAMKGMPAGLFGGFTFPPFITANMLKGLPKSSFMETFASAFNTEDEKMIPLLSAGLSPYLGQIRIDGAKSEANPAPGILLTMEVLIGKTDEDWLFNRMFSLFPDWECVAESLGEEFSSEESLKKHIEKLQASEKEFAALRLMSRHKAELAERVNRETAQRGTPVVLSRLRFLMPA